MRKKQYKYSAGFIIILFIVSQIICPAKTEAAVSGPYQVLQDTTASSGDSSKIDLPFPFENRSPYSHTTEENDTGLYLQTPPNIRSEEKYDPEANQYIIEEKIGEMDYRPSRSLDIDEYKDYRFERSMERYWSDKRQGKATDGVSSFIPELKVGGEAFNKIFGSNTINITPRGSAELIFAIRNNKTENPNIQERLRSTTTFDFEENIKMDIQGTIGDKVKLGITYDTKATFDFENKTKIGYTGHEDEIIQTVEAGNISLPLTGSLITGSQNLFGLKTELKFGNLTMTNVFSQQKGKRKVIEVEGGAQLQEFEVEAADYDKNRHFFLSHFFKDNYNDALKTLPIINSGVTITKIEVWITNNTRRFENSRDIVGFIDIGENTPANIYNENIILKGQSAPSNDANDLYANVKDIVHSGSGYTNDNMDMQDFEYENMENARKLNQNEYNVNNQLGYISLNNSLNSDEILAVAFEYQYRGKTYRVGELTSNNSETKSPLVVKLLKGTSLSPRLPTWELMMKNIYAIGTYQVNREDFELNVLYRDDKTGSSINYLPEGDIANKVLLRELGLDQLNSNNDAQPDGVFDYVNGVTILPSKGRVIFPVLEPFGEHLASKINDPKVESKYVYNALYDSSQVQAMQIAEKNKFLLTGRYKSSSGSEISLNAMNIPQGSVIVTAGGNQLQENSDYTVDYTLGRVKILNEGVLESGTPIQISLESSSLYSLQTKTLVGTNLDYKISDDFRVGGTILNLTEKPLTTKVNLGSEPISNTIWGVNTTYKTKSQFLTTMVDKLPLIDAKKPSSINFFGEFAHLIPGHSKAIEKEGNAYIDDFEGSETRLDMRSFQNWSVSSTPRMFSESTLSNDLAYGYNRAKLAWFVIDPLFLRDNVYTPEGVTKDMQSSHFVREIFEEEIFPYKENPQGIPTNMPVLNLAFFPQQKGPYNYETAGSIHSAGINQNGYLNEPESRWGGIMREITTKDFEESNIAFIDFWIMDPFIEDYENNSGGDLFFNLGEISEDILKDGKKSFENGFPGGADDTARTVDSTTWGLHPSTTDLNSGFIPNIQDQQDVGLDGLNDIAEQSFFTEYLNEIENIVNTQTYEKIYQDPANDNFEYYKTYAHDERGSNIIQRYKNYNGLDGNSPTDEKTDEDFSTAGKTRPDKEDINNDQTLNQTESYYQYKVSIRKEDMKVGTNYITDKRQSEVVDFPNGESSRVNWYHFRIPIRDPNNVVGAISDFKSIRFMRMFLSNFSDSTILRFARLDLVRSDWRKYTRALVDPGEGITIPEMEEGAFDIGAVNIEENGYKTPVNYVLPPGINRMISPGEPQLRQLNEQAILLKVQNLEDGDARAAYKNINLDIREYKRLKMFVHAESLDSAMKKLEDGELKAFIRIGSDYKNNFYEYEIPLKVTPPGKYENNNDRDREIVWPEENEFNIRLDDFIDLKLERNRMINDPESGVTYTTVYSRPDKNNPDHKLSIAGNPNMEEVRTVMIGLRNPKSQRGRGEPVSAEVWMNELRLSNFREEGGWAANARVRTQLSDFASVSISGGTVTPGFGSIEKSVSDRSKENEWRYDISSNVRLGKFFPEEAGVRLPMYVGYSQSVIKPQYDPLQPDVLLKESMNNIKIDSVRQERENIVNDVVERKSLNFTNVGIEPNQEKKPRIYSPSNIALNYAYNETNAHNENIEYNKQKQYKGGLIYNYSIRPKPVEPLKNVIKSNSLRILRDFNFNYVPSRLSFQTILSRRYNEKKIRNLNNLNKPRSQHVIIDPTVDKDFIWSRDYGLKYDISRSLRMDFQATNYSRIDEPIDKDDGMIVNKDSTSSYNHWKDSVKTAILDMGRTTQYNHKIGLNYNLPINKINLLNWISSSVAYSANYDWKAGPVMKEPENNVGNTISNSNSLRINGQTNLTSLYNKAGILKRINQKYSKGKRAKEEKVKEVTYVEENINLLLDEPKTIHHKLNTDRITDVKVTDARGEEVRGEVDLVSDNRLTFTTDRDYKNVKIEINGEIEEKENILIVLAERTTYLLMAVKNVSASYTLSQGTQLPGFEPTAGFFGSKDIHTPGWEFITGIQDRDIGIKAIENDWLINNSILNTPTLFTNNEQINLRTRIEPINDLQIDLNGSWSYSKNISEFYIPDEFGNFPDSLRGTMINGNFSMSSLTFGTAFERSNKKNNFYSEAFSDFKQNRQVIAHRVARERADTSSYTYDPGSTYPDGYGPESQEVLISSFLAAYSKQSPDKINLNPFPSFLSMMPNWRVRYDGLSSIDWINERFRSVRVNHSYRSSYNVGNYITNTNYMEAPDSFNIQGNYYPRYDIANVAISEQFTPLIGFDVTLKNSMNARIEIRKSRTISLSLSNNRISEMHRNEFVVGTGYRFKEVEIIINTRGSGQRAFNSDLNVNANFSIRDHKNILRDLDGPPQPSTGQRTTSIELSSDYNLSERFTLRLFFDREISTPLTSISYPTKEWRAGFSLRFTLTQLEEQE